MPTRAARRRLEVLVGAARRARRVVSFWARWITTLPLKAWFAARGAPPGTRLDLIIAGLPKAGTTQLVELLELDPRLRKVAWTSQSNELRYFSARRDHSIHRLFTLLERDGDRLNIEKSPDYCVLPLRSLRWIKRLYPDVAVVLIFREPVERAHSHARMDLLRSRAVEAPPQMWLHHYRVHASRHDYPTIARRFDAVFGDRALLVDFDALVSDPRIVIDDVYALLGITTADAVRDGIERIGVRNRGPARPMTPEELTVLTRICAPSSRWYADRFGDAGGASTQMGVPETSA